MHFSPFWTFFHPACISPPSELSSSFLIIMILH
jgi:hypothetical protein